MRLRITFSKTGPLIYIGNLDLHTLWERAARRAALPLAYSRGFHPQPKMQFAAPLPLGFSSRCELLDMWLTEDGPVDALMPRLNAAMPQGARVLSVNIVPTDDPALPTQLTSADYEVTLDDSAAPRDLQPRIGDLIAMGSILRERRGRTYDLRPLIEDLVLASSEPKAKRMLRMRLKAQEGATGRPDEVLEALEVPRSEAHIERTALNLRTVVPKLVPVKG